MGLRITGDSSRIVVRSAEEIQDALDVFSSMVQEAILIDGREYRMFLTFSATEVTGDELDFSEPF